MSTRPKISVCMATYNGERFVAEQIVSILPQLGAEDELVIVDDASCDGTVAAIQAVGDPRIRLYPQSRNGGVVSSFELALRHATGEILFLSDMDDRWAPNKVERFLEAFRADPKLDLVISALSLMDENGRPLVGAAPLRRPFSAGFLRNLLENTFQGSALAIRASVLPRVLPFPRHVLFLHDVWIGTRLALLGGKVRFLNEPLIFYRRHSNNASAAMPLGKRLWLRAQLLTRHVGRLLKPASTNAQGQRS